MRPVSKLPIFLVLLTAIFAVAGCGAPPERETLTLASHPALSGEATSGSVYGHQFEVSQAFLGQTVIAIPDLPPPLGSGGFIYIRTFHRLLLSFALPPALEGAEIVSAQLELYLISMSGTPLINYGAVQIVHANFTSSDADVNLYSSCNLGDPLNAFASATVNDWATVDVTDAVKNDLDNDRGYAQFRLQHQNESLAGTSGINTLWTLGTASTANYARLVIVYVPTE